MTPKEIHSLVVARAKHGTLIDRCVVIVYYIALWVGGLVAVVCSVFPIPSAFVSPEYWLVTLGIPFGLLLLAWAIFEWLKRRLL